MLGFESASQENEPLDEATRLLSRQPTDVFNPLDPFTFGLPMILYSEYMRAGELNAAVKRCQYNPYELVTDGFGRGSERLIMAEAAMMRCQMKEAVIYAERAIEMAKEKQQYFIIASAYYVFMRRALFLGDTEAAVQRFSRIRALLPKVMALSQCFLYTSLRQRENIPPDFLDGTHKNSMVGLGISHIYSARAMHITGSPAGTERMCLELDRMPNLSQCTRLYGLILTALSREKLYGTGAGQKNLILVLTQAQQDGVLLSFTENPDILPMLGHIKKSDGVNGDFLAQVKHNVRNILGLRWLCPIRIYSRFPTGKERLCALYRRGRRERL